MFSEVSVSSVVLTMPLSSFLVQFVAIRYDKTVLLVFCSGSALRTLIHLLVVCCSRSPTFFPGMIFFFLGSVLVRYLATVLTDVPGNCRGHPDSFESSDPGCRPSSESVLPFFSSSSFFSAFCTFRARINPETWKDREPGGGSGISGTRRESIAVPSPRLPFKVSYSFFTFLCMYTYFCFDKVLSVLALRTRNVVHHVPISLSSVLLRISSHLLFLSPCFLLSLSLPVLSVVSVGVRYPDINQD